MLREAQRKEVQAKAELAAIEPGRHCPPRLELDLPKQSLPELIRRVHPDAIVNAAAHTAVDKAESEPELAHRINAEAPAVLAREAAALGALLVHYSTDYVFDGSGDAPRADKKITSS